MRRLWDLLEAALHRMGGVRPVERGSILGLCLRRYRGPHLVAADGSTISPDDLVLELHLENAQLNRMLRPAGSAQARIPLLTREMTRAMRLTARMLQSEAALRSVQGLLGVTLLHRGVRSLGLEVSDMAAGPRRWLLGPYLRRLLAAYHPDPAHAPRRRDRLQPRIVFISRAALLARYGQDSG